MRLLIALTITLILASGCTEYEVDTRDGDYESYHECVQNNNCL
jgi:hypothetical protein